jgi:hypothetical protein
LTINAGQPPNKKRQAGARLMLRCFRIPNVLIAAWNERQEKPIPTLCSPTIGAAVTVGPLPGLPNHEIRSIFAYLTVTATRP